MVLHGAWEGLRVGWNRGTTDDCNCLWSWKAWGTAGITWQGHSSEQIKSINFVDKLLYLCLRDILCMMISNSMIKGHHMRDYTFISVQKSRIFDYCSVIIMIGKKRERIKKEKRSNKEEGEEILTSSSSSPSSSIHFLSFFILSLSLPIIMIRQENNIS